MRGHFTGTGYFDIVTLSNTRDLYNNFRVSSLRMTMREGSYGFRFNAWLFEMLPPTCKPLGTEVGMVCFKSNALGDVNDSKNASSAWISASDNCTPSLAFCGVYHFVMAANVSG